MTGMRNARDYHPPNHPWKGLAKPQYGKSKRRRVVTMKHRRARVKITREDVEKATAEFLRNGGTVTRLEDAGEGGGLSAKKDETDFLSDSTSFGTLISDLSEGE
jgi:hypothetical protein